MDDAKALAAIATTAAAAGTATGPLVVATITAPASGILGVKRIIKLL